MELKLIDAHTHLNFEQFEPDRAAVIERMRQAGIGAINVGTDRASSEWAIKLAHEYPDFMWATVGLHPTDADQLFDFEVFKKLAQDPKVVAVGECGLDVRSEELEVGGWKKQVKIFEQQINLAQEVKKPLMLHIRNAYAEVLDILISNIKLPTSNVGNVHFFAGNTAIAKQFLDLGFTLSFTGVLTFTTDYDEAVRYVPLDRLLVETDAPFVTPAPHRGRRNEPAFVPLVASAIAKIKNLLVVEVAAATLANTRGLFAL